MPAAFIIFVGMIGVGEGKACVILDRAIFATLRYSNLNLTNFSRHS